MRDLEGFVTAGKRASAGRIRSNLLIHKGGRSVSFVSASLNRGFELSLSLFLWTHRYVSISRKPGDKTDKTPGGVSSPGDSLTGCTDGREHRQGVPSNNIDQR